MSLPPATGAVELVSYKQHVVHLLTQKKRLDERPFDVIRTPHILHDTKGGAKADSVLASTLYTDEAGTCVNCTVSGVFGPPPSQHPEEGRLTVNVAAPFFPSYITDKVERALRETAWFVRSTIISCMDLTELSVFSGEACWVLQVELVVLNADGGLRAAALHAAVAALHNLMLPKARLPNGDIVESKHLRFHRVPVAATIGVFGAAATGDLCLLFDTNAAEESVVDGLVTVVLDESDGIVTLLHHGRFPLLAPFLTGMIDAFASRSAALRSAILKTSTPPIGSS
ncbi:putative exosome-associated protein 2, putative,3 exoribonuclease [Trypanosoma grayi]|uniref:putative exosome-associated protein 2, putative,3 exoribonuclease n=1 Tax=Trypanosoma grayi TaxID=71804 RepID=UPI0004F3FACE|nr:putative exosome-associated protein 2, putative,3 exoribonuclease [Trypanosoma grayi]KEG12457.1 putative exosome-associated protein 2, putative,3 exoribonuclease [Trypanosoma grayi]